MVGGHCILVAGPWLQKVVVLAVPCELYHGAWTRRSRLTLSAW